MGWRASCSTVNPRYLSSHWPVFIGGAGSPCKQPEFCRTACKRERLAAWSLHPLPRPSSTSSIATWPRNLGGGKRQDHITPKFRAQGEPGHRLSWWWRQLPALARPTLSSHRVAADTFLWNKRERVRSFFGENVPVEISRGNERDYVFVVVYRFADSAGGVSWYCKSRCTVCCRVCLQLSVYSRVQRF